MTFDDAIEELRLAIPESFYNPTMHDIAVMLETQTKVINELRQEYAPTIEMTQRAYEYLKEEHDKFVETGKDTFLSNNGLGNWRFNDENRVDIESGETYIDEFTAAHNHFKGLTRTEVIQAWLHPETIKVID